VFSCEHPFDDWQFVNRRGVAGESYFKIEQYSIPWGGFGEPKPVITAYRRPLNAILNPLIGAGFRLDHFLEPLPTEAFQRAEPDDYLKLMREPGFLCVRAIKA
jgi:hypothetical protein